MARRAISFPIPPAPPHRRRHPRRVGRVPGGLLAALRAARRLRGDAHPLAAQADCAGSRAGNGSGQARQAPAHARHPRLRTRLPGPGRERKLQLGGASRSGPDRPRRDRRALEPPGALHLVVSHRRAGTVSGLLRPDRCARAGTRSARARLRYLRSPLGGLQHARLVRRPTALEPARLRRTDARQHRHPRATAQHDLPRQRDGLQRIVRDLRRLPRCHRVLHRARRPAACRPRAPALRGCATVLAISGRGGRPAGRSVRGRGRSSREGGDVPRRPAGVSARALANRSVPRLSGPVAQQRSHPAPVAVRAAPRALRAGLPAERPRSA